MTSNMTAQNDAQLCVIFYKYIATIQLPATDSIGTHQGVRHENLYNHAWFHLFNFNQLRFYVAGERRDRGGSDHT